MMVLPCFTHMIPKPNGESDKRLNMIDVSSKHPKDADFF